MVGSLRASCALIILAATIPETALSAGADSDDGCALASSLARTIIENRYRGVSMAKMVEVARSQPALGRLASAIVVDAYSTPKYSTE